MPRPTGRIALAVLFGLFFGGGLGAAASPSAPPAVPVGTPADAAARVISTDARFSGVLPPGSVAGQSAWYEAWESGGGYQVSVTLGFGDCSTTCPMTHVSLFAVSRDGLISPPVETGDPIPAGFLPPVGAGPATFDLLLDTGPSCPVQQVSPSPACEPQPVVGVEVIVRDAMGREIAHATSDAAGHARGTLETGVYVFEPRSVAGLPGAPAPAAASLLGPGGVSLILVYDTGIR